VAARSRRRKRGKKRGGIGQRVAIGLSVIVLVLCASSISFSLFVRHTGADGTSRRLRVELLNGTGVAGIAESARAGLAKLGVDVVAVGNAERFDYSESILVARERGTDVRLLGDVIGCAHVVDQLDKDATADASLILGADYKRLALGWTE
jgi:LytR cell envelope-related transcriptional attenuator